MVGSVTTPAVLGATFTLGPAQAVVARGAAAGAVDRGLTLDRGRGSGSARSSGGGSNGSAGRPVVRRAADTKDILAAGATVVGRGSTPASLGTAVTELGSTAHEARVATAGSIRGDGSGLDAGNSRRGGSAARSRIGPELASRVAVPVLGGVT